MDFSREARRDAPYRRPGKPFDAGLRAPHRGRAARLRKRGTDADTGWVANGFGAGNCLPQLRALSKPCSTRSPASGRAPDCPGPLVAMMTDSHAFLPLGAFPAAGRFGRDLAGRHGAGRKPVRRRERGRGDSFLLFSPSEFLAEAWDSTPSYRQRISNSTLLHRIGYRPMCSVSCGVCHVSWRVRACRGVWVPSIYLIFGRARIPLNFVWGGVAEREPTSRFQRVMKSWQPLDRLWHRVDSHWTNCKNRAFSLFP